MSVRLLLSSNRLDSLNICTTHSLGKLQAEEQLFLFRISFISIDYSIQATSEITSFFDPAHQARVELFFFPSSRDLFFSRYDLLFLYFIYMTALRSLLRLPSLRQSLATPTTATTTIRQALRMSSSIAVPTDFVSQIVKPHIPIDE